MAQHNNNDKDVIYANGKPIPRLKKNQNNTYREDKTYEQKNWFDKVAIIWALAPRVLLFLVIIAAIVVATLKTS